MNLIVTVDTEADNQWKEDSRDTIKNVFALPRFQALCERYAIVPTYLATYEVAADARAAAMLKHWQDQGLAEVGAHLHPWTTPPFMEAERGKSFPSELSDGSLRAKLSALTEAITDRIGKPTSYRAGRWGFDMRQAKLLAEFGYLADSSVTPGISWAGKKGLEGGPGGPDFSGAGAAPYPLNDAVLEVPMTILPTGLFGRRRWLRIFEDVRMGHLRAVVRAAKRRAMPALVFMIHSSELVPGESPYVKDAAALESVYARLESLFAFSREKGMSGLSLSDFAKRYRTQPAL